MIDIHCHILPGFDDGASCMEEAIDMANLAAMSGVSTILCTSHFRCDTASPEAQSAQINRLYRKLKEELAATDIPIELLPGAELLCLPDTPRYLERGVIPTLNGTKYLLCEFLFNESPAYMNDMLERIAALGYTPVVAHPERYAAVRHDLRIASHWFGNGYLLQINKGSILGSFGSRIKAAALEMLYSGLCHMIASDAHSAKARTPVMKNLVDFLEKRYNPDYISLLLERNPARLIKGQPMIPTETPSEW